MLSRKLGIPTPAEGEPTESFFYCNQVVSTGGGRTNGRTNGRVVSTFAFRLFGFALLLFSWR